VNVAVLVKQTPDTAELPKVTVAEAQSGELQATMVINPWDEFAVEEAIDLSDRFGCDTIAVSMGREGETDALKHALAMGVDSAVHVDERVVDGGDEWATAEALAAAVKRVDTGEEVELVLAGKMSVDGNSSVIYAGVACKLGWDLLVNVTRIVDIVDGKLIAEQAFEGGQESVEVPLPVVISVAKEINEPRYPSFMGIRKASRATIPTLGRDELEIRPSSTTRWTDLNKPEPEDVQVRIFDGASIEEKVTQLADALMAEKVI